MNNNVKKKFFKKYFSLFISKIKYYEIILKPFLEKIENYSYIKLPIANNKSYIYENKKINKLFISRIKKDYNGIISNIFFDVKKNEYKYKYNNTTNTVSIFYIPKMSDFDIILKYININNKYDFQDIIDSYETHFLDHIESGPDGWLQGDITYIKKNEVDNFEYTINNNYLNIKFHKNKERPSPSESATLFDVGIKKMGNNNKMWIITKNKNGVKKWKEL